MLRSSSSRSLEGVQEEADQTTPLRDRATAHARQHSRIHARNLSEFFPRPGHQGVGYGGTYDDPHRSASPLATRVTDISSLSTPPKTSGTDDGATSPRAQNRRGHHHRHSVSHNLFPFLDPSSSGAATPDSPSKSPFPSSPSPSPAAEHLLPTPHSSFRQRFEFLPLFLQIPLYSLVRLPLRSQLALMVAFSQMSLGATLWIQGQSGESLSVTGLGYLVVFDGLGALSSVVLAKGGGLEKWRREMGKESSARDNLQQPFGLVRLSTLSHFSQAIYLLFSAVYVCKESIEHVLLLHGPTEGDGAGHGSGHGGVGHGEGRAGGTAHTATESISFPLTILLLSATLAVISAVCFRTHSDLAHSVSPEAAPARGRSGSIGNKEGGSSFSRARSVLNPFTMTVAGFGFGLFGAAVILPTAQLSPLDKILSLLVSLSMFYVAYPAAQSTGKILLQTAPARETREARGLQQGIKDIESHPLVMSIETPHVWQLLPSSISASASSPSNDRGVSTVVTLTVVVKPDVDEKGMFEVGKWVEERCRSAGNVGAAGSNLREVTVEVRRST
ncbi:hypothetical protein JCM11491_003773 [Sporobolomyces phaffii]